MWSKLNILVKMYNMTVDVLRSDRVMSAARAKRQLAEAVREAESGQVVLITRYGKPVAALVSLQDALKLQRLAAAEPRLSLASVAGRYADGDELAAALEAVVAQRTTAEPALDLDSLSSAGSSGARPTSVISALSPDCRW